MQLHTDEARKISDEAFHRALLTTQDTNVAAPDTTTSQSAVRNVGAKVTDNSKVAIVTFLSDAPKEAKTMKTSILLRPPRSRSTLTAGAIS
jgi:hypothetical protein